MPYKSAETRRQYHREAASTGEGRVAAKMRKDLQRSQELKARLYWVARINSGKDLDHLVRSVPDSVLARVREQIILEFNEPVEVIQTTREPE